MTRARHEQVSVDATPYYHCINRCVRRAFLCGEDRLTGKSFDHRYGWLVERLKALTAFFALHLSAFAVMSNGKFHLVVRVDRERALGWTDEEALERYTRLFGKQSHAFEGLGDGERAELAALWRERLWDLS